VISTDDAGVARSDLTNEYMRAVVESGLSYQELVAVSFDSLHYGFIGTQGLEKCSTLIKKEQIIRQMPYGCKFVETERGRLYSQFQTALKQFERTH
jgi:hypothetical protein